MTPAARLAATIAIVSDILGRAAAADRVLSDWQRRNRYAGAKDRRAIGEAVYAVLREQGMRRWRLEEAGAAITPRLLVFADAATPLQEWQKLCTGEKYAPPPLSEDEAAILSHLPSDEAAPLWARVNLPPPVAEMVQAAFGPHTEMELSALNGRAPLDLRVNTLKTSREDVLQQLRAESIGAAPTPFSPLGIRIAERVRLETSPLYTDGLIEPQDEGSQIAAQLADAANCKFVVDFCAGAGGKTLVLAAAMRNVGRLVAMDVSAGRLTQARLRLRRAGVHNAETRELDSKWIKRHSGQADRVLVDAPCTGTGTWRRKPDAKWRLTPKDLEELVPRQAEILDRAARLVKPQGRLIYVTCSVLREENDDQVAAFLKRHPDFKVMPVTEVWPQTIGGACPVPGPYLALSPARHGTDGFFAAILVRHA